MVAALSLLVKSALCERHMMTVTASNALSMPAVHTSQNTACWDDSVSAVKGWYSAGWVSRTLNS